MNLMHFPITNTLVNIGVDSMAQRIAQNHFLIAGRLSLFTPNWKIITKDQWVLYTIQGYEINLVCRPHHPYPPVELKFPQTETEELTE